MQAVNAVGSANLRRGAMGDDPLGGDVRRGPQPLERRIGIMQGRLVRAATGELECSPGEKWRDEFRDAAALRLNHIELVADRFLDSCNPIWSSDGRDEIVNVAESTGVEVASLCLNEVLASPIDEMSDDLVKRVRTGSEGLAHSGCRRAVARSERSQLGGPAFGRSVHSPACG